MTWHDCDGEIGELLRKAVQPAGEFNDGQPTWFIMVLRRSSPEPLAVSYCPICGERLPPVQDCPMLPRVRHANAAV